ncbi:sugar transferase [Ruegeria conchae]|uniref:sugar transferase n=1 Tax=Ruegeria conchae TaxID=981384 RepID=UPI0029C6FCE2|nr:sugar transferase [Ruegeria conchae]
MTMISIEPNLSRKNTPSIGAKRVLDVSLTALGLLAIWPVLLVISIAVASTSPGPVFFVQTRVGRDGRTFRMLKFRSMYQDAENRRRDIEDMSDRDGICLKVKCDPRITPVGRFIRRWSLDELPQLFNVLSGDMSLVGPRPALVDEVAAYPNHALGRHEVLPGITGLWQVSGRADIGFEEMIALDLDYVRQSSLGTDVRILFRTFYAVIGGKGAY